VQIESAWDYDPCFKDVMGILTFQILDQQHQEWFIAGLLPHIRRPLIQHKACVAARGTGNGDEIRVVTNRRH
jgi:hypothetical protein